MTCCEDARMQSKAPIRLGKGNLPVRVKALGNSGWRASAKNSAELICSVSWEKRELRVNPIFFWHELGHSGAIQKNKLNEINQLRLVFYLNFGELKARHPLDRCTYQDGWPLGTPWWSTTLVAVDCCQFATK